MVKFRGKNGDWAIPIVAIIAFGMVWVGIIANEATQLNKGSEAFLETYGYTNIVINKNAIGCQFDDVTSFKDRGRGFSALMPSGKKITGVVCTAKNNVSVLNVNYQEK